MKQFNLEEYLKNPSRKVVTLNGRSVRIICIDRNDLYYPIVALVKGEYEEDIFSYTKDGKNNDSCIRNLYFAPEKHEGWVNVYKGGDRNYFTLGAMIYDRKEDAERCRVEDCVATTKIEWEE